MGFLNNIATHHCDALIINRKLNLKLILNLNLMIKNLMIR